MSIIPSLPHVVYRCYDHEGHLLYIGCTWDINARLNVHASSWSNPASAVLNMRMTRYEVVEYPDKATARQAERKAIYDEAPLLNLHHQRERITPAERYLRMEQYLEASRPPIDADMLARLEEAS